MLKKTLIFSLITLIASLYANASSPLLMPKKEQAEDFTYYQNFHWSKKVERKVMYEAIANGQFHMYDKMMNCQTEIYSNLEDWLKAFKMGSEEVLNLESERQMRDMDDNIRRYPDDGEDVATWLTRDYAEKNYQRFTGSNLNTIKENFWQFCLEKLPVKLFTKEAKQHVEAKIKAEIERESSYP